MTRILLFIFLAFSVKAIAQTEAPIDQPGIAIGANTTAADFMFNYKGRLIPHYGLSWYNDTDNTGAPMAYLAGYAGVKFFTAESQRMVLSAAGNLGIGTSFPMQKFVVSNNGAEGFEVFLNQPAGDVGLQAYNRSVSNYVKMRFDASNFAFNHGNVGIGVYDTKGYKLAVGGTMIADSITVKLQGSWPDFVFLPGYHLPNLLDVEKYIREKGHLPGVPSALEVKNEGINLGEMNAKLLKQIEELTLHLIEKDKQINHLNDVNTGYESRLQALERKLNNK